MSDNFLFLEIICPIFLFGRCNFIVCDVFRGVGQIALDVIQFIGVFFHEKVDDHRGVFEDKIYHTGGNKHIDD